MIAYRADPSTVFVRTRTNKLASAGDLLEVGRIVVHEDFDKYVLLNDIALIKVHRPLLKRLKAHLFRGTSSQPASRTFITSVRTPGNFITVFPCRYGEPAHRHNRYGLQFPRKLVCLPEENVLTGGTSIEILMIRCATVMPRDPVHSRERKEFNKRWDGDALLLGQMYRASARDANY